MKLGLKILPLVDELPTGCVATDSPFRVITEVEVHPFKDGTPILDQNGNPVKIVCDPKFLKEMIRTNKFKEFMDNTFKGTTVDLGNDNQVSIAETVIVDPTLPCDHEEKSGGCIFPNAEENRKLNHEMIHSKKNDFDFPSRPVVVILGGGPSLKTVTGDPAFRQLIADKENVAIVTVSESQNYVHGDYYLAAEGSPAGPNRLADGTCSENTVGIFCAKSHPNYYRLRRWKAIRWYTHHSDGPEVCERFWSHRHAMYDAIQFAVRYLKPKHVVFAGIDGAAPLSTLMYHDSDTAKINLEKSTMVPGVNGEMCVLERQMYWLTVSVESCAWMLRRKGIISWNISGSGVACRSMLVVNPKVFLEYHQGHRI